jgi:hypothetical protein
MTAWECNASHMAVTDLLLVIAGAMNFTFTLALHAAAANVKHGSVPSSVRASLSDPTTFSPLMPKK